MDKIYTGGIFHMITSIAQSFLRFAIAQHKICSIYKTLELLWIWNLPLILLVTKWASSACRWNTTWWGNPQSKWKRSGTKNEKPVLVRFR